jgi:hypothetical protein
LHQEPSISNRFAQRVFSCLLDILRVWLRLSCSIALFTPKEPMPRQSCQRAAGLRGRRSCSGGCFCHSRCRGGCCCCSPDPPALPRGGRGQGRGGREPRSSPPRSRCAGSREEGRKKEGHGFAERGQRKRERERRQIKRGKRGRRGSGSRCERMLEIFAIYFRFGRLIKFKTPSYR